MVELRESMPDAATPVALGATIYYMVHHIIVQTTLFLAVGLIERRAGSTSILKVKGLMRAAPLLAVLYFIPAINLGGMPPFSGFLGKIILIQAGANEGSWLAWVLIGGALVTSLLTLYVMMLVWAKGFLRDNPDIAAKIEGAIRQNSGIVAEPSAEMPSRRRTWPTVRAMRARSPRSHSSCSSSSIPSSWVCQSMVTTCRPGMSKLYQRGPIMRS